MNVIQEINILKQKYPELKVRETNKTILKKYPNCLEWIRRPKICLRIDDFNGIKNISTETRENLIQIIIKRRHMGIWFCGIALHRNIEDFSGLWTV